MWRAIALLILAEIVRSEIERNTAGAVFIPETPVIISSGLEATWVTVPIPGLPAINLTHLDLAYQEFQLNLAIKWRGYDGTICGDQETHDRLLNSTYVTIKGVEYEVQEIEKVWRDIKDRIGTFVNGTTNPRHGRERRGAGAIFAGIAAVSVVSSIVLAPVLKEGFCHYMSFFGFCGSSKDIDRLGKESEFLDGAIRTVTLESGEKIHLLGHSLNKTQGQLRLISKDANANFHTIRVAVSQLAKAVSYGAYGDHKSGQCEKSHEWASTFKKSIAFKTEVRNFSDHMTAIKLELIAYKVALHSFGYVLDGALGSLAQGHIPATLIPPEVLLQVLDGLQLDTQKEAIPRNDLMTYYGFELVESTIATHNSLNILLNIPVHHTNGFHRVYRAVPIPQPIANGSTATKYRFNKNYLLVSEYNNNFAEVTEGKMNSHCRGSSRLLLCMKPFPMARSSSATCLSSLFFNLPTSALRLCPHEVEILPDEAAAEYLDDSTYLITSSNDDFKFINYTRVKDQSQGEQIPGCKSCLIRPSCHGRVENPTGTIVLYPDSRTCQHNSSKVVIVEQHPLLQSLFEVLRTVENEKIGVKIPETFVNAAHEEMIESFRLNLVDLPEGTVDQGELELIARPFAEHILDKHTPFHWKAYHSSPLRTLLGLVAITILLVILWLIWKKLQELKLCPCQERLHDESFFGHLRRTMVPPVRYHRRHKRGSIDRISNDEVVIGSPSHSSTRMILDDMEGRRRSWIHNRELLPEDADLPRYEPEPAKLLVSSQGERTMPRPSKASPGRDLLQKDFGRK